MREKKEFKVKYKEENQKMEANGRSDSQSKKECDPFCWTKKHVIICTISGSFLRGANPEMAAFLNVHVYSL